MKMSLNSLIKNRFHRKVTPFIWSIIEQLTSQEFGIDASKLPRELLDACEDVAGPWKHTDGSPRVKTSYSVHFAQT